MADIVVLGGGPTGLATSLLLAQQGLDVVVLDRDEAAPDDPEEAWESWQRRDGVFERVLDVALSTPPYSSPGPTRAELEELLV